jgi:hypothetical protein
MQWMLIHPCLEIDWPWDVTKFKWKISSGSGHLEDVLKENNQSVFKDKNNDLNLEFDLNGE